jgi:hypothetical protein
MVKGLLKGCGTVQRRGCLIEELIRRKRRDGEGLETIFEPRTWPEWAGKTVASG